MPKNAPTSDIVDNPAPTIEQRLEASTADVTRLTSDLAEAQSALASVTTERDTLVSISAQFDALSIEATQLRNDLSTATASIATLTTERDTLASKAAAAASDIARLETLCGVKGIDPKSAAPTSQEPGSENKEISRADFDKLSHTERNEYLANGGKITA